MYTWYHISSVVVVLPLRNALSFPLTSRALIRVYVRHDVRDSSHCAGGVERVSIIAALVAIAILLTLLPILE